MGDSRKGQKQVGKKTHDQPTTKKQNKQLDKKEREP
jgi:hypothetical protein